METVVELAERQLEALARFCREEGISQSEAIRRAVDQLVSSGGDAGVRHDNREAGFGLWREKAQGDSRAYVEVLRAEWDEARNEEDLA